MASRHPPTTNVQAPVQTPGVYDTVKECFVGIAKMMEKGYSPQVFTDDRDVIITPIPTRLVLSLERLDIENSLELSRRRLSNQSK
jgi:hypothetical protein